MCKHCKKLFEVVAKCYNLVKMENHLGGVGEGLAV
jgi:hypothetical protein